MGPCCLFFSATLSPHRLLFSSPSHYGSALLPSPLLGSSPPPDRCGAATRARTRQAPVDPKQPSIASRCSRPAAPREWLARPSWSCAPRSARSRLVSRPRMTHLQRQHAARRDRVPACPRPRAERQDRRPHLGALKADDAPPSPLTVTTPTPRAVPRLPAETMSRPSLVARRQSIHAALAERVQ